MTTNFGYAKTIEGKLKIAGIILQGILLALTFCAHFLSDYTLKEERNKHNEELRGNVVKLWREQIMLAMTILSFLLSIVNLIMHLRSVEMVFKPVTSYIDCFLQYFLGLGLAVSGILFVVSAVKLHEINCTSHNDCQLFEWKLGAGGIAVSISPIFFVIGSYVLANARDAERNS